MSMVNENLEQAVVAAALELSAATMAHAFSIPIPNTTPQLYVSLHEGPVQLLQRNGGVRACDGVQSEGGNG